MSESKKTKKSKKSQEEPLVANEKKSAYDRFLVDNKKPWIWFNILTTLGSIGLAVGTFLVVWRQREDCGGMKTALWLVFIMHIVNALETLLNLTGLERKLCTSFMMCGFFIFEVTVLIYMQVVYFEAMQISICITNTSLMYFWLMA